MIVTKGYGSSLIVTQGYGAAVRETEPQARHRGGGGSEERRIQGDREFLEIICALMPILDS